MIHESVIEAVGGTPLVRLSRLHEPGNLVAKVDYMNPAGSVKERIAVNMIDRAEQMGLLREGGTIIEPTSGNTGAGLAMVGAVRGYRVICTVPDKVAPEKIDLLRAYGTEVIVTPTELPPEDEESYYGVARRLTADIEGAYSPDQYSNRFNPEAHYLTTGPEIWDQTEGLIDVFVAGIGTGGTITGVGRYLREQKPEVEFVGADPEGSIFTAPCEEDVHQYWVEGVGEDFWPETLDRSLVDRYIMVDDRQSFDMAPRSSYGGAPGGGFGRNGDSRTEGLLVEGDSGGMARLQRSVWGHVTRIPRRRNCRSW